MTLPLKHDNNGAHDLLKGMQGLSTDGLSLDIKTKLSAAITYFTNQQRRMDYPLYRAKHFLIGSGVTEAACKTLVKQRLCRSGMKWQEKGARLLLSLRALVCTKTRFEQFWNRVNTVGLSGLGEI